MNTPLHLVPLTTTSVTTTTQGKKEPISLHQNQGKQCGRVSVTVRPAYNEQFLALFTRYKWDSITCTRSCKYSRICILQRSGEVITVTLYFQFYLFLFWGRVVSSLRSSWHITTCAATRTNHTGPDRCAQVFHVLAVCVYLPGILVDVKMTYVASTCAIVVFIILEVGWRGSQPAGFNRKSPHPL